MRWNAASLRGQIALFSSHRAVKRTSSWKNLLLKQLPLAHKGSITSVASFHSIPLYSHQTNITGPCYVRKKNHCLFRSVPSVAAIQCRNNSSTGSSIPDDLMYIPTPVEWTYELLEYLHDEMSLSWWLAIIAATVFYKGIFAFPFALSQQRVFARIENAQPEINTFVEQAKQQTALKAKEQNWSKAERERQFDLEVKAIVRHTYFMEKCSPLKLSYVAFAQMGIWISMTMALGQMTGWYPEYFYTELDIDVLQSLSTGGTLWFSDLMQSDLLIPIMLGMVNLTLVELWSLRRGPLVKMQHRFHNLFRVLAVSSMPVAAMMPCAVSYYWLVSSLFGLGQFALLRTPSVRRYLDIPQAPSEMKHPLQEMKTALKIKYLGKRVF